MFRLLACRFAACVLGSFLVLLGACDDQTAEPHRGVLTASTTQVAPLSTTTTTTLVEARETPPTTTGQAPASTTTTTASTTTTSTTTTAPRTTAPRTTVTTIPAVAQRQYEMYERGGDVIQLQMLLGLASVDGVYGPLTRATHINALGGPTAAVYRFFPEFGRTPTSCSHDCLPGDGHYELPTLGELVDRYFQPGDRAWALRVAFCESSAKPSDIGSVEVSSALAVGWFQHLARYWIERSTTAGWADYDIFNAEANVAVAAWLFYEGGGPRHWNPSRTCWEAENGTN